MSRGTIQNAVAEQKEIMKAGNDAVKTLALYRGQIEKALPNTYDPDRFLRIATTVFNENTALQRCDFKSFLGAMMTSAQLGLEPNTPLGLAYIIPYGNKATFQLGYQGLMTLAYRSRKTAAIFGATIYEGDEYDIVKGTDPHIIHRVNLKKRGEPIAYYGVYKTVDGFSIFDVMTTEEVQQFRKRNVRYKSEAWDNNFEAMAWKTVLKRALKFAPKDAEILAIHNADGRVREELSNDMLETPGKAAEEFLDIDSETVEVIDGTASEA